MKTYKTLLNVNELMTCIQIENMESSPVLSRGVSLILRILLYKSINLSCNDNIHYHDEKDK